MPIITGSTQYGTANVGGIYTDPWPMWFSTTSNATTGSTLLTAQQVGFIWQTWMSNTTALVTAATQQMRAFEQYRVPPAPRLTPEQQRAAQLKQEEENRKWRIRDRWRNRCEVRAKKKAEEILLRHLSDEEKERLKKLGFFHVKSSSGRIYRVRRGCAGNIALLDQHGQEVERLCVHPSGVPDQDAMLTQKLWLEYDEEHTRRTANITRLRN